MKCHCFRRSRADDRNAECGVRHEKNIEANSECGVRNVECAMKRTLEIRTGPIEETEQLAQRHISSEAGAVIYFLGIVRGTEEGKTSNAIEYETFQRMAEHQFNLLFDEMEQRWPIESVRLIHRVGMVKVNEPSLWVEVIAPHRGEAFAACQWLIDEMKRIVPIWKKPLT